MGCCVSNGAAHDAGVYTSKRYHGLSPTDVLIMEEWDLMDRDKSGNLDFKELKALMQHLNVQISDGELRRRFKEYDVDGNGTLERSEFRAFFDSCQNRPGREIDSIFATYGKGSKEMCPAGFVRFLREHQGETLQGDGLEAVAAIRRAIRSAVDAAARHQSPHAPADAAVTEYARDVAAAESRPSAAVAAEAQGQADMEHEEEASAEYLASRLNADPLGPITLPEFMMYIVSPLFNALLRNEDARRVTQDMTAPLSHYYVSSTHNTYLAGNQLSSKSTPNAIRRALSLGGRVIELDCYDGRTPGEPKVTHGGTLTSSLSFRAAVRAVAEYAFRPENVRPSEYPVILTLENHCSHEEQAAQARILREELGEMLYEPPFPRAAVYPSPEELKRRVAIRDKPKTHLPSVADHGAVDEEVEEAAAEAGDEDEDAEVEEDSAAEEEAATEENSGGGGGAAAAAAAAGGRVEVGAKPNRGSKKVMHPDLMALVLVPNVKFKGLNKLEALGNGPTSSSFSETKIAKVLGKSKDAPSKFVEYTQQHLARVYPAGTRIDSSNYDPSPMWNAGAQFVALNYQYGNLPVFMNQAFFAANGGCGYRRKPASMLRPVSSTFDPTAQKDKVCLEITVSVISGHYLPKPNRARTGEVIDPYVEVLLRGAEADCATRRTTTIQDNGFNPRWADETGASNEFRFQVRRPETAILLFAVHDEDLRDDDFIGYFGCPVESLQKGLRVIPLFDMLSVPLPSSSLFVRVSTRELK